MKTMRPALLQVVLAILLFLVISIAYMYPALEGKSLHQGDIVQYKGSSKEIVDFREKTGKETLWTNSMFSGMPTYLIAAKFKSNILRVFHYTFILNNWRPVCFVFLYLLGFYIALLAFGVNRMLSLIGAIAYGFSSYFFVILVAGHNAKALALGYLPPIVAGVYLAFQGRYLLGSALLGFFLSLQILIVHLQITYYTFIIILVLGLIQFIYAFKEKKYRHFLIAMGCLSIGALLAVASNFASLWTTQEYGQYSIRGKSDLSRDAHVKTSGLDKDYATDWSYGVGETFTLLIPNFHGGASAGPLSENSKTFELLKQIQGGQQARKTIKQMPTYWGDQPSTAGPVYVGAIIVFLFVLGLFLYKGSLKWWLLTVTILAIMLSWGKNFMWFTNLFMDFFPGYNKFRSVSMTLIMAEFAMPLLGILTLNEILKGSYPKEKIIKSVLNSFYITGGICFFFILTAKSFFDFNAAIDEQYLAQGATEFVNALKADRLSMLRGDAFRSFIFIALAVGILYLYLKEKLNQSYLIAGLGLLIIIDMWAVDKRYVNNDDFITKKEYSNPIPKTRADDFILQNGASDPNYRVLNLAVSTFNDATTSYYHKSLGGYHGAKMRRYQEIIEMHLYPEIQSLIAGLRQGNMISVDSTLSTLDVLNMLNTRYIIYNPEAIPLINEKAFGNAWFVSELKIVNNADEEIQALGAVDLKNTMIINKDLEIELGITSPVKDSLSSIQLISYEPNSLVYKSASGSDQLAVFSEIYYPKGWEVAIDGNKVTHFRANFLLRAMKIPAGNHEIKFTFKPRSYYTGNKIAFAGSGILLLLLIGTLFWEIKKIRKTS